MFKLIFTVSTLLVVFFDISNCKSLKSNTDFCKFTCNELEYSKHVLCAYKEKTPSKKCGKVIHSGLTSEQQRIIVDKHNELRQKVKKGLETRGLKKKAQPAALEMPDLTWDEELALFAQRWADQCIYEHICSTSERFEVGQNLFQSESASDMKFDLKESVESWYDEVVDFDGNKVKSYSDDEGVYSHYTQIVWAKTTKIGCGYTRYFTEGVYYDNVVCNYGPAGNFEGHPVYRAKV